MKSYPAIQSLISGEQSKQEANLIVSWESLERRKSLLPQIEAYQAEVQKRRR